MKTESYRKQSWRLRMLLKIFGVPYSTREHYGLKFPCGEMYYQQGPTMDTGLF